MRDIVFRDYCLFFIRFHLERPKDLHLHVRGDLRNHHGQLCPRLSCTLDVQSLETPQATQTDRFLLRNDSTGLNGQVGSKHKSVSRN